MSKISIIAFTQRGFELAERIAAGLEAAQLWGSACAVDVSRGFGECKVYLPAWMAERFSTSDALVFVGASGIAVRAIAPHVASKTSDPAVVVVDERARFSIPLLSGHIGGANELARAIAQATGAQAAVTTATDVNGLWAVDEWAARSGLAIENPGAIKHVSSRLLAGKIVRLYSDAELVGELPPGVCRVSQANDADVVISSCRCSDEEVLHLVPRCITAGIGCRRGIAAAAIEEAFAAACSRARVSPLALCGVASIDIKAGEPGLLEFCEHHGLGLATHSADELARVQGSVSSSAFVARTVGVDCVCERAALACGGELVAFKLALNGVTVALARLPVSYGFANHS